MTYLYDNRISYRNLKLDNILLDVKFSPKQCNFECAEELTQSKDNQEFSETRGTKLYIAPEIH